MRPLSSSKQQKRLRAINRRIVCGILLCGLLTLICLVTDVSASAYGGVATSTSSGNVANAGFLNTPNLNKPDLAITMTNIGGFNFLVGQQITYYLDVSNGVNAGPVLAPGPITVTDDIPAGLISVTPTGTDWSFAQTDSNVTATYTGTYPVAAGQTLPKITLTGTLTADGLGQLTNTAKVSTPHDSNPSNNTSSDTIMLTKKPDLWIIKTNDGGDTFEVGQQVTYHLVVQDVAIAGPVLAPGPITVTEDIPSGLIVNSMSGKHWSFSQKANTITINYTGAYPIKPGQTLPTITIKGTLTVDGLGQLTNTATVTTPNDYSLQNNTAQDIINVGMPPDLSIVKTTKEGDLYYAGQAIHYLLKVKTSQFAGQALAGDPIVVKDNLPIGLTHVSLSGLHWSFHMSHRKVIATYKGTYPVPSGTQLPTIVIGARLTNQALHLTGNTAHVGTVLYPDAGSSSTKTVVVYRSPDLELTKTNAGGSYFLVGQTIHYHLSVHNLSIAAPLRGPGPITVIDYIPDGLDRVSGSGHNWRVEVTPTRVIATYTGAYPVHPGTMLPTITVTGTFTRAAVPFVVNKASVRTPRDFITDNDRAQRKVHVRMAPGLPPTGSGPNETSDVIAATFNFWSQPAQLATTSLIIPAIKVNARIVAVGVQRCGNLDVPSLNPWANVGWDSTGARPGESGSAVIDGHLNRPDGSPAVFWRLHELKVGANVYLLGPNRKQLHFRVMGMRLYTPATAPLGQIFGNQDGRYLNLITCAGSWLPSRHETTRRLIVYTRLEM